MWFGLGDSIFAAPNGGKQKKTISVGREGGLSILKSSLTEGKRKILNWSEGLDE